MCGIAGLVGRGGINDAGRVERIVGEQAHRGPDDSGLWVSPDRRCVLGHDRLSIIDLSAAGHQPMVDPLTGNAIVFNGEIYNFRELREECRAAGDRFYSRTDTEVILALFRRYGTSCLSHLRGMFAFAIWDAAKQRLFLARDRVGKKPLNYALTGGGLVFSSEIDPLARHGGVDTALDEEALAFYLQLQYIPAPWTIYRSIRKLPPAHYALFSSSGLVLQQYWDVDYRDKIRISEADALEALEEKLRRAVELRLVSDVPLGTLLSGGVDSSVVVALVSGLQGGPVKTFSIGFEEEQYSELDYAAVVAGRYRTEHHPEIVRGEVEPLLEGIARRYGEPFADSSAVPTFHVCRTARRHVTVALTGDGGDELLGGYPRYWLPGLKILSGTLFGRIGGPAYLADFVGRFSRATTIPAKICRRLMTGVFHPELMSFIMYLNNWNDAERGRILSPGKEPAAAILKTWRERWLRGARRSAGNPIDRMLWMDNRTYLPGDLLVKMDIASMHCGLEARSPFLDHELIEFCASLPAGLKVRGGTGKYLLKKLAEKYLPRDLVYRPKMGFGIPLDEWLKSSLRSKVTEVLSDEEAMFPLHVPALKQTLGDYYHGRADLAPRVWTLLMYGVWNRQRPT